MHRRVWQVALLTLLVGLAACGSSGNTASRSSATPAAGAPVGSAAAQKGFGSFKVGLINPASGVFAEIGKEVDQGFQLYLDQKGGSLAGWKIDVDKGDEGTTPQQTTTTMHKFVEQDRVNLVVGLVNSANAYAVRDYIDASNAPTLITVAGADGLTQKQHSQWIFRVSYTGSMETQPLADYVCKHLPYKKVDILASDYAFGWEASGGFARIFTSECGGKILQEIYAPLNTADWGPYIQKIDKSADAIFTTMAGADPVRFLKQYQSFGLTLPIIGHGGMTDETILQQEGPTANGLLTTMHYSSVLENQTTKAFIKSYQDKYGSVPSQYGEDGYTAAQVLEAALQTAGAKGTDAQTLRDALAKVNLPMTARGSPLKFDDYGQGVFNVYVRKVQQSGSQWVNQVIFTYPQVSQFWTFTPQEFLAMKPYAELKGTWAGK